jgi:hypothetical protein
VAYDEHGRMWVERPFWTQATYVVDRNLMGLSWEERKEAENASEHYGDLARFTHYRSADTAKTFWDERIIMIPLKNEAADAMDTATWTRYAQTSIQVRYGDIRVSIIAGEMAYSTPRMFLPHVDRYTEWELAMFREPGRTLDALTGVISGAEKDTLPQSPQSAEVNFLSRSGSARVAPAWTTSARNFAGSISTTRSQRGIQSTT